MLPIMVAGPQSRWLGYGNSCIILIYANANAYCDLKFDLQVMTL